MKIRIKDNSVRFRLTQTEVQALSKKGHVEAHTDFGNQMFVYRVRLKENLNTLQANFLDGMVTLEVPRKWGEDWYENDTVGLEYIQKTESDKELYLLLEKDFTCLDNTLEDQSDNYPNPKLQSS